MTKKTKYVVVALMIVVGLGIGVSGKSVLGSIIAGAGFLIAIDYGEQKED